MAPNNAVVIVVGRRLSTSASWPVIASAGSARHPRTRVPTVRMRSCGSVIVAGTGKRAGANLLPPGASDAVRRLIGIVIRSASIGSP
jgi:hypothetical protein